MRNKKYIKGAALFAALFCLLIGAAFGQKRKSAPAAAAPLKPAPKKTIKAGGGAPAPAAQKAAAAAAAAEISPAEWSTIISALDKEDWTTAERLSALSLEKLKTDNDKKQLARLRYFYIFALTGRAASGKLAYPELEKSVARFIGKEFLMPSRQVLSVCQGNVNYICPVRDNEKMLRVTATNKSGSAIHSFEYIQLTERLDFAGNRGKQAFVGGNLQKAEINLYKSNIPIIRLIFDRGFVNIVSSR
jgi:hypothetical protein